MINIYGNINIFCLEVTLYAITAATDNLLSGEQEGTKASIMCKISPQPFIAVRLRTAVA